ncbi:hypothetical protein Dvina_12885 [Dactylosporangium vinaceum]|uniref:Uncharacterized protein n=1 Tax=Dactylosporangium vinaceum TaxID=53362 RepID=A0ABV5MFY5_9ACTN|nr:hypothetical protein [Dactylosporangium vinaceum]UAB98890.1 hypothetical protein Dvina_12885 [Dactylosporangium vinaceum]
MILRVEHGGVTLDDLDDLKRLSAHVEDDGALGEWGRREAGHVVLTTHQLLRLAGARAGDSQWRSRFDGMVDYARRHGWIDGDEVRMHIVGE